MKENSDVDMRVDDEVIQVSGLPDDVPDEYNYCKSEYYRRSMLCQSDVFIFSVIASLLAVQCERKPITKPTDDGPNESHLRGVSLSPPRHMVYPAHQEKPDFEPLTPTSPNSLSPQSRCSPAVSSSVIHPSDHCDGILSSENIPFKLNPPTLGVSSLSMEYVYEIATRLLFLTVDWTRNIQAFRSLETTDQLVLLQNSWSDLFMLGVAQCSSSFPLSPLLTLAAVHMERSDGGEDQKPTGLIKDANLLEKMMSIKELLFSLEKLEMDLVEYAFLKTIVLFNPGNSQYILYLSL